MESKCTLQYQGNIAILSMNNGENRINAKLLGAVNEILDQVESSDVQALVTIGSGKFYCNGFDLDWISKQDKMTVSMFMKEWKKFLQRLLVFPMPTIAAINGHCFAAGALFALSHDYRVMQTSTGWFCFPEIHIKLPFGHKIHRDIIQCKVPGGRDFSNMMMFGKRYNGQDMLKSGVVDAVTDSGHLMDVAVSTAVDCLGAHGYDRTMLTIMKSDIYSIALKEEVQHIDSQKLYAAASKL